MAQGLAAAGATVWMHGPHPQASPRYIAADLREPEAVCALARTISTQTDRLDVLVNNAGVEISMPIEQLSLETLRSTLRINAEAPLQLISELLPLLKAAGTASIINMTSIHETVAYASNVAYCMSKAALAMATKVASLELAPFGIRVNNLAPGAIETDINRHVIDAVGRSAWADWIPVGRVGTVEDVVGPAVFLASDASSYVSGVTLFVDGAYQQNLIRYRPSSAP